MGAVWEVARILEKIVEALVELNETLKKVEERLRK